MPIPDWSAVEWFIYSNRGWDGRPPLVRVVPRKLKHRLRATRKQAKLGQTSYGGELRVGESLVATVAGCSRATVLAHLRAGVPAGEIQKRVGDAADAQNRRTAAANARNHYREWIARLEAEKRALKTAA